MISLNLIPDIKQEFLDAKSQRDKYVGWSVIVGGGFIAIAVVFGLAVLAQWAFVTSTRASIEEAQSELDNKESITTLLTAQGQLLEVPRMHQERPRTIRLFSYLSTLTPEDVRLSNVEVDMDNNRIDIIGTTESIRDLNIFVDTLKLADYELGPRVDEQLLRDGDQELETLFSQINQDFSDIELSEPQRAFSNVISTLNIRASGGEVGFTIQLDFNRDIFDAQYSTVRMTVDGEETRQNNNEPLFEEVILEEE